MQQIRESFQVQTEDCVRNSNSYQVRLKLLRTVYHLDPHLLSRTFSPTRCGSKLVSKPTGFDIKIDVQYQSLSLKMNSFLPYLQYTKLFGFPKQTRISKMTKILNIQFQFTSQPLVSSSNQLKSARRVVDMHSFVKAIKIWRRHVEVSHGESPLLVLTMQHQTKVKWRYTAMPL